MHHTHTSARLTCGFIEFHELFIVSVVELNKFNLIALLQLNIRLLDASTASELATTCFGFAWQSDHTHAKHSDLVLFSHIFSYCAFGGIFGNDERVDVLRAQCG